MDEVKRKEYTLMEGNLLEYPVFSMQRGRVGKTVEEYIWQEKDETGKITRECRFKVDCTEGIPNFFDMDVFNTVMRIYVKKNGMYEENEVHFTLYELMKELDLPVHDGRTVSRVRESLERMAKTNLHFENSFYAEKRRITKIMHLITRIEIYERQKGTRSINMIKVVLDDELADSIKRKYYKLVDFGLYRSLSTGIPRRLYEYLEKKKYKKDQFEIGIKKLAKWIGLKTSKPSRLREFIGKANNELKEKEIIDNWEYNGENVVYYFCRSEKFKEVPKLPFKQPADQERITKNIEFSLRKAGYSEEEIKEFLDEYTRK